MLPKSTLLYVHENKEAKSNARVKRSSYVVRAKKQTCRFCKRLIPSLGGLFTRVTFYAGVDLPSHVVKRSTFVVRRSSLSGSTNKGKSAHGNGSQRHVKGAQAMWSDADDITLRMMYASA